MSPNMSSIEKVFPKGTFTHEIEINLCNILTITICSSGLLHNKVFLIVS